MKSQVLHTVLCNLSSGEAAGENLKLIARVSLLFQGDAPAEYDRAYYPLVSITCIVNSL